MVKYCGTDTEYTIIRGAGLSSSFGGGDGTFFGKGNDLDTILSKATIALGTAFGVITLALAKLNA